MELMEAHSSRKLTENLKPIGYFFSITLKHIIVVWGQSIKNKGRPIPPHRGI
jgi:hypothetical protein